MPSILMDVKAALDPNNTVLTSWNNATSLQPCQTYTGASQRLYDIPCRNLNCYEFAHCREMFSRLIFSLKPQPSSPCPTLSPFRSHLRPHNDPCNMARRHLL